MSSNLLHDFGSALDVQRDSHFVVRNGREALAHYIENERKERGWSYGEIVRRSEGFIKSPSTIGNIVNGNVETVSEDTLRGLAKAFKVSEDKVFDIYRGKALKGAEAMDADMALFASRVKKLTPQQRRDFEIAWRMANDLLDRLEKEKEQAGQK